MLTSNTIGATSPKEEGHFGIGIKMPKFGGSKGSSSSSSEDDGTGKRVKKVKASAKVEANVSVPKMDVDAHAGSVDAKMKGCSYSHLPCLFLTYFF